MDIINKIRANIVFDKFPNNKQILKDKPTMPIEHGKKTDSTLSDKNAAY